MLYENNGNTLSELDLREKAYRHAKVDRSTITLNDTTFLDGVEAIYLYESLPEYARFGGFDYPILLSYLDAVLLGYWNQWGAQGVHDFISSTDGWQQVPILNDRCFPRYPRHIPRTSEVIEAVKAIDCILDEMIASKMQTFRVANPRPVSK